MQYPKILTIQDISCVGQCSLTVALPVLSACGVETCILPSAVLSTHTGGFKGFTFRDLTEDMPKIAAHWQKENIFFDCVYTGYLGSAEQIAYVKDIFTACLKADGPKIVDPAMADGGKLYTGFDMAFVGEMKKLVAESDICLPNITEAALLTGLPWKENYDEAYVRELTDAVLALGPKTVVLTGVSYDQDTTGVVVASSGVFDYYRHQKFGKGCHGTGDIYASAFVGAYMRGKCAYDAAKIAADYVVGCIKETAGDETHWYGAKFEPVLKNLIDALEA